MQPQSGIGDKTNLKNIKTILQINPKLRSRWGLESDLVNNGVCVVASPEISPEDNLPCLYRIVIV